MPASCAGRTGERVNSAKILAETDAKSAARIEELARTFVETGRAADLARLDAYAKSAGASTDAKLTAEEEQASKLIPRRKPGAAPQPAFGGGGGRGGAPAGPNALLPGSGANEARLFADGKRSILDIRDAVSAEFFPMDAAKFIEFFRELEKAGQFEIAHK